MPVRRRARPTRRISRSIIPNFLDKLEWRNAGPFRGGRVGAVAGDPRDRNTFYFGSTGGGVWKTGDGGLYWENVSDGFFKRASVGAIAVSRSDPNVIYAGMGESCIRGNVSHGDGVYRSTDAGKTWTHLGLERTRNIGKLRVHPEDPDTVYVAALGHAHGTNPERGVFRSRDGGKTWKRVLYRGERAGAIDISMDANNPRNLYATIWEAVRRPYELVSGGPGSGIFRSNDAGDTWTDISHARGLPKGILGKIGIAASAAKSGRVFAIVESEDGAVFRSDDGGDNWERGSEDRNLRQRAWYYNHIYADPKDPETAWVLNVDAWRSNDGGKTFVQMSIPHGDHHDLWIDPDDPNRMIEGNDGGGVVTFNGGESAGAVRYRFQWTAPIALSPHDPNVLYHCGNRIFRTRNEGESWEAISPDLTRNDPKRLGASGGPITKDNTGAEYYCTVFAFAESPVARGVLWAGSDDGLVHVSRDDGKSWKNVTPKGIGSWALVSIIEASPHDAGTAYVAANRYKQDDFRPYLFKTKDYGRTWTKITRGIPDDDFTRVIRADPAKKGLLYAGAETGAYFSFDDGGCWQRLGGNLPVVPIHDLVIKDDDLVLGTHGRAFCLLDDLQPRRQYRTKATRGKVPMCASMVTVRYRTDMGFPQPPKIGKNYRMTGATMVTYRQREKATGEKVAINIDAGTNPPSGVLVQFWLRDKAKAAATLGCLDARGKMIREFKSDPQAIEDELKKPEPPQKTPPEGTAQPPATKDPKVPVLAGLNRFLWNMRYPDAAKIEGEGGTWDAFEAQLAGPQVPPGPYRVRLKVAGETLEAPFEIRKDPRIGTTQEDLEAQTALALKVNQKLDETHRTINAIRKLKTQLDAWEARAKEQTGQARLAPPAASLRPKASAIGAALVQVKAKSRQDTLNYPAKLNAKVASLVGYLGGADYAPTKGMRDVFDDLSKRVDAQIAKWQSLARGDVAAFDKLVRSSGVPAVGIGATKRSSRPARVTRERSRAAAATHA